MTADICPACNEASARRPLAFIRGGVASKCQVCGVISCLPLPDEAVLTASYDHFNAGELAMADFQAYAEQAKGLLQRLPQLAGIPAIKGSMLDYGCGGGHFVSAAMDLGLDAVGMDLDPASAQFGREHGIRIVEGVLPGSAKLLSGSTFNLIVCMHVIEHVPRPWEVLTSLRDLAADRAVLLLAVPDQGSIPSRLKIAVRSLGMKLGEWGYVQPPIHLHGYDASALSRLLEKTGWTVKNLLRTSPTDKRYFPSTANYWRGLWIQRLVYLAARVLGSGGHFLAVCEKVDGGHG